MGLAGHDRLGFNYRTLASPFRACGLTVCMDSPVNY
jgi:hypothetical protein